MIKIFHISDIHFHESPNGDDELNKHSLHAMEKLKEVFEAQKPDILVVTGDLTDIGDKRNLARVYQWIHDSISVEGNYYGLCARDKNIEIVIVPGNHDAFGAHSTGARYRRWQESLANYQRCFPEYALSREGIDYQWFEKNGVKLYLCTVDSTYLGDPETENVPGFLKFDRIAKGRISKDQCEQMLELHDKGMAGDLTKADDSKISSRDFEESLKILIMHHYIFEPEDSKCTPALHLKDKRSVFQNIAMADFDCLLCGHKHVADYKSIEYMAEFEPRGKIRLALNYVRRALGLRRLPLTVGDTRRPPVKQAWRILLSLLYLNHIDEHGLTEENAAAIINKLEASLISGTIIKREVYDYLKNTKATKAISLFEANEMAELHGRILRKFPKKDFVKLQRVADGIKPLLAKLANRPFLHIVAGSACKTSDVDARQRSFNIYTITKDGDQSGNVLFECKQYKWHNSAGKGNKNTGCWIEGEPQSAKMPLERRSWLAIEGDAKHSIAT